MTPNENQATGEPTGDPAVDALVVLARQTAHLPVAEHKARFTEVLTGLERELDADPAAAHREAGS